MSFTAPQPGPQTWNWTAAGVGLAVLVQFAAAVTFGARASAEIAELQKTTEPLRQNRGGFTTRLDMLESTTEPLRRGDLVKIQTDVAWIRERLAKEEQK